MGHIDTVLDLFDLSDLFDRFLFKPRKNSKIRVVSSFDFTFASGRYRFKINVLGLFFYNIFLILFKIGIRIAALFNAKAKKWVQGRKEIWEKLEAEVRGQRSEKVI